MPDLNDLRVFERVGSLGSFSAAAKALAQPRSNVSRSISRLEASLGTRLVQRTTREVTLTAAGDSLLARCTASLRQLDEALSYLSSLATEARGQLRVSAGIGFGINVLADQLPGFLRKYPNVDVLLDLTSRIADLVAERVDVAIRFGQLSDSSMVAARLGEMRRVLCASPAYIERKGEPSSLEELVRHETIEMPNAEERSRTWTFTKDGQTSQLVVEPRVRVNDALTIHRLVQNGTGIGIISCYLCAPDIEAGRLLQLLPEWTAPPVAVNMLFPSRRELSPAVRAFVAYMQEANPPGSHWQKNDLLSNARPSR